jgi:hypothetical protein
MKKALLISFLLVSGAICHAQHAEIKNDTAYYQDRKFFPGQTITLLYGSGINNQFSFVNWTAGAMVGPGPLTSQFSKFEVILDKVYISKSKVHVRGKLVRQGYNPGKITIDIEGAIDKKEI